jgi:AAA domain
MGADDPLPLKFIAKPLAPTKLLPAPVWLIKGVLPEGFLSLLKGLPGSFKTFETVSMVCCLATGQPWLGYPTKKCNVLYIAADDPDGPRMRAQAWCKYFGLPFELIDAVMFDQGCSRTVESLRSGSV